MSDAGMRYRPLFIKLIGVGAAVSLAAVGLAVMWPPAYANTQPSGGRISGVSRVETAVEISRFEFPDGAEYAYLARADEPADAVAGGVLSGGPILLVPSCGAVPASVAEELARLQPSRVLALGGHEAVCEELLRSAVSAAGSDGLAESLTVPTTAAVVADEAAFGDATLRGRRSEGQACFWFQDAAGRTAIRWPPGYSARATGAVLELLDDEGAAVARAGDILDTVGGSYSDDLGPCHEGQDGVAWHVGRVAGVRASATAP